MLKWFNINILLCFFVACNGEHASSRRFSVTLEGGEKVSYNKPVQVKVSSKKDIAIDSVAYVINGVSLKQENGGLTLKNAPLGHQELEATVYYGDSSDKISVPITILADREPELYTYEIIKEYPHDGEAFTQGLEFYRDTLYESTGRRGHSSLRKTDYATGKVWKKKPLEQTLFGEGLTIMNDRIYQLTWQAGKGLVYDMDFNLLSEFDYGNSKEGWGLCNDGTRIFKSDGTSKIWILDPETLEEKGHIETVTNTSVFSMANELEYAHDRIYANTWQKDGVMIINPENGIIEGVVDLRGLKDKVTQKPDLDVLNGIAHFPERDTFFVTGKNWDKIFEVKIVPKGK
ncbi:glutaminyl-peptide cyclotransferase [Sinomicrobium soli]|uniref:glutaminyl-peptide cyclotransferase n=1 Tax=Sinomicrobium sp. N-1-3-6 TaxID=2219864 RepID=UPI000DCE7C19|nr:glutaminyl-peptide cyclotransferase [Sinomicrobium sp. N-1-3-6]RAV28613.1 glutaminyl-peptide cyclotransferase [Sinomicrobium sp. N-1-3-6]